MPRKIIPVRYQRAKLPLSHIMAENWVIQAIRTEAERGGVTIKATIERILTDHAARIERRGKA